MNTITLDNATYEEMSDFAKQNNVSIPEMLKDNWHDFLNFVKAKKEKKYTAKEEEFLRRFRGSEWENDKSSTQIVEEYRRNNRLAPHKKIEW